MSNKRKSLATAVVTVPTIGDLIGRFEVSNRAEGTSPKTTAWHTDMLMPFSDYAWTHLASCHITCLTVDNVRQYIIYSRNRPRFQRHPYTPEQDGLPSPRTVQCHVRALKAFATWLYNEGHAAETTLKNLKLPKAPINPVEPPSPEEVETIISSIDKDSATGTRNHALLVTVLDTGLRASEAANTTVARQNLRDGTSRSWARGPRKG